MPLSLSNQQLLAIALATSMLFVLDVATPLNIHSLQLVFLLLVVAVLTTVTYVYRVLFKASFIIFSGFVAFLLVVFAIVEVLFILGGGWQTQSIDYVNRESSNTVIEFQMKDVGALGYRRRTVEKIRLLPGINWMKEVDSGKVDTLLWKPVHLDVNELGLLYP
ncbi:hypothetical protein [Hymenobacter cellulosilyticus]|uniref:Uncharacterized protein n=1 Tax=Hymenobacter cellulosilyticus TaxID=2932248 RepID=A0A8T9Q630_9BACT|nr:hypothetical protein [Hymenobacter cellulosilyticus]UOQ70523.1 hypothetical protein MUN79_17575 [Hymenobacter cellulosilyticus]